MVVHEGLCAWCTAGTHSHMDLHGPDKQLHTLTASSSILIYCGAKGTLVFIV